jgi:hypothetical protein
VVWIGDMPFYYQGNKGKKKVKKLQKEEYLFSWDDVTENESTRQQLIMCLKHDYDIGWVERAEIYKTYDSKTICISDKSNTKNFAKIKKTSKEF